jgi:hypothetical protein
MGLQEPVAVAGRRVHMREEGATAGLKSAVFAVGLGSGGQSAQACRIGATARAVGKWDAIAVLIVTLMAVRNLYLLESFQEAGIKGGRRSCEGVVLAGPVADSEVRAVECGGCEELEPVCPGEPGRSNCQNIETPDHPSRKNAVSNAEEHLKVTGDEGRPRHDLSPECETGWSHREGDRGGLGGLLPHVSCVGEHFEGPYGMERDVVKCVSCQGGFAEGSVEGVCRRASAERLLLSAGRVRKGRSFTSWSKEVSRVWQEWCGYVLSWQFISVDSGEAECKKCRGETGARSLEAAFGEVKRQDCEPANAGQRGACSDVEGVWRTRRVSREWGCFGHERAAVCDRTVMFRRETREGTTRQARAHSVGPETASTEPVGVECWGGGTPSGEACHAEGLTGWSEARCGRKRAVRTPRIYGGCESLVGYDGAPAVEGVRTTRQERFERAGPFHGVLLGMKLDRGARSGGRNAVERTIGSCEAHGGSEPVVCSSRCDSIVVQDWWPAVEGFSTARQERFERVGPHYGLAGCCKGIRVERVMILDSRFETCLKTMTADRPELYEVDDVQFYGEGILSRTFAMVAMLLRDWGSNVRRTGKARNLRHALGVERVQGSRGEGDCSGGSDYISDPG